MQWVLSAQSLAVRSSEKQRPALMQKQQQHLKKNEAWDVSEEAKHA